MELFAAVFVACWVALVTPRLVQIDIAEHRLPNDIVLPGWGVATIGMLLAWMLEGAFPIVALGSGLLAVAVAFIGALAGGLGMGDVKLLFPLGVGLGLVALDAVLFAALVATVSGGVVATVVLIRHRRRGLRVPFGPFLLLGYWAGYFA